MITSTQVSTQDAKAVNGIAKCFGCFHTDIVSKLFRVVSY